MNDTAIDAMIARIHDENNFEGSSCGGFPGVKPEVVLSYFDGGWMVSLECEGESCFFAGKNEKGEVDICRIWADEEPSARQALEKLDQQCREMREKKYILSADAG